MKFGNFLCCLLILTGCTTKQARQADLHASIISNPYFAFTKEKALEVVKSGFSAGEGYGEVWIRDYNTFIELSAEVFEQTVLKENLLVFFRMQGKDGNILDGFTPKDNIREQRYQFIYSDLEPRYAGHKNTVETDQESSLVQAVYKYVQATGDWSILAEMIGDKSVAARLEWAMDFLLNHRFNEAYGLIWGATTADWGDVQPEHDWGVYLTGDTHYAIDIYDNAMFLIALDNLMELVPPSKARWQAVRDQLAKNTREHLWDENKQKFVPHIYLNGSPFPEDFNENEIFYHGGTAVAIEAGLLSKDEVRVSLEKMVANVKASGAGSIGLTLYPTYPEGSFKNPSMHKYGYQNGGDWTWFGGRMIQQLIANGLVEEAYEQIQPMVKRVKDNDGFFEWYTVENQPKGSGTFRGSAGVLYKAIVMLEENAIKLQRQENEKQNAFNQTENIPNILIIMTDQQAWNAVGYSGNSMIKTPNLDRLAGEGVNFSQAVTPCPVCVPARTSILTGRLTEKTTIRENGDAKTGVCYYPTFDEILAKNGFHVEVYGKFHAPEHMARVYMNPPVEGMEGTDPIMRWEPIYVQYIRENFKKRPLRPGELYETTFYGGTVPYKPDPTDRYYKYLPSGKIPEKELETKLSQADIHGVLDLPADYTITAVQGQQAIDALERLKDERFVLTASFHCPHVPITPSEPYASMYRAGDMPTAVSIEDRRENAPYNPGKEIPPYNNKKLVQYMVANYYAFVTEIDDWVGKILEKLDELELAENTLVVFVSDHGEMLGAHGMRGKFCFYEESVRVPFLMRYPGRIKPAQTISTPVSILNIFPTVLEYAGIKSITSDGYSLKGLVEGSESPRYDFAVSEWQWKRESVPSIMIRTEEWKLMTTHRKGGTNVEALYDLKNDPYEMNNLLGSNPERFEYEKTAEELRSKLVGYLKEVNDPLADGVEQRILVRE